MHLTRSALTAVICSSLKLGAARDLTTGRECPSLRIAAAARPSTLAPSAHVHDLCLRPSHDLVEPIRPALQRVAHLRLVAMPVVGLAHLVLDVVEDCLRDLPAYSHLGEVRPHGPPDVVGSEVRNA